MKYKLTVQRKFCIVYSSSLCNNFFINNDEVVEKVGYTININRKRIK